MGLVLAVLVLGVFAGGHLALWRHRPDCRSIRTLATLYGGSLALVGLSSKVSWIGTPIEWCDLARMTLISGAVFLVYLSMYTAVERDSVSSMFLLAAERAGAEGVPVEDLLRGLSDEDLVLSRLDALKASGMVVCRGEKFCITWSGRVFLAAIRTARRPFTSRPIGG